jgi:hypothetical protein
MIAVDKLQNQLCRNFCADIQVNAVPAGIALSFPFTDSSGDKVNFYLVNEADQLRLEDDGDYLSSLIASGIDIDKGQRSHLLDGILRTAGAHWDRDTFVIKTDAFSENAITARATAFISALIRTRDLELLTREVVRSTFREDALAEIKRRFSNFAEIEEDAFIDPLFKDFPSDVVLRLKSDGQAAAIYFVSGNERLSEALLLLVEAGRVGRSDFKVVALIEEPEMPQIGRRKFQRAQNRGLIMPIFRGDEAAAIDNIAQRMGLPTSTAIN